MACPWFLPQQPMPQSHTGPAPRTPLGELWNGLCCASGNQAEVSHEACNSGYARSRCSHFPAESPHDAVRFHVAGENGDLIRLQYIYEREWWPGEHGVLEYSRARGEVAPENGNGLLGRQAAAFAESWIRRTTLHENAHDGRGPRPVSGFQRRRRRVLCAPEH